MKIKKAIFYVTLILFAVLVAIFLYKYRLKIGKILKPFFLAILVSYIVKPIADSLVRKKIPYVLAILSIYLVFILSIGAACIFLFPELVSNTRDLLTTLPDIMSKYEQMLDGFLSAIESSNWSVDVKNVIFNEIQSSMSVVQSYTVETLRGALGAVINTAGLFVDLTLAMFIAYYIIKDTGQFKSFALTLVPRRWRNGIIEAGKEINAILSNFIQGQMLTALIVAVMETIGLMMVKIKYPLVLGMIGGVANIIPYFGPFLGAIPAVAVALIQSPLTALWTVAVFAVVQQIDNSFISPKMIEGRLGLHPVATVFAVLVGGEFFGVLGMLLAVPVMAILRVIVRKAVDAIA